MHLQPAEIFVIFKALFKRCFGVLRTNSLHVGAETHADIGVDVEVYVDLLVHVDIDVDIDR